MQHAFSLLSGGGCRINVHTSGHLLRSAGSGSGWSNIKCSLYWSS
jgi:hypothetical protein